MGRTNVPRTRNWRTLVHMRQADTSCALLRGRQFSAWNDVMAAILKAWRQIENQTRQSMRIHLKKNVAKFHSNLTCMKSPSLWLFWRWSPNKNQRHGISSWIQIQKIKNRNIVSDCYINSHLYRLAAMLITLNDIWRSFSRFSLNIYKIIV